MTQYRRRGDNSPSRRTVCGATPESSIHNAVF